MTSDKLVLDQDLGKIITTPVNIGMSSLKSSFPIENQIKKQLAELLNQRDKSKTEIAIEINVTKKTLQIKTLLLLLITEPEMVILGLSLVITRAMHTVIGTYPSASGFLFCFIQNIIIEFIIIHKCCKIIFAIYTSYYIYTNIFIIHLH